MGSLGDNLLKLTEFPFSYSFLGLLTLIFGRGVYFEQDPLTILVPLLILMGFFATTLSIIDPIGVFQKWWLRNFSFKSGESLGREAVKPINLENFQSLRIFGTDIAVFFGYRVILSSLVRNVLHSYIRERQQKISIPTTLEETSDMDRGYLYRSVLFLREWTLTTIWVRREIDKVTAIFYFIIVIITFITALSLLPTFEERFVAIFQVRNQSQGDEITITNGAAKGTIDMNANNTFSNITGRSSNTSQAKTMIIFLSIGALVAVSYMVYRRLKELRRAARRTFFYLMIKQAYQNARGEMKIKDEPFEKQLKQIEHYLTNRDWTLALFQLNSLGIDYENLFFEKLKLELDRKKDEDKK